MNYPYFQTVDSKTRRELGRKGGLKKSTPQTLKAWDEADKIKELHNTLSYRKIAKQYGVSRFLIEKIIKS